LFRGQNTRGNPPVVSSEVSEGISIEADVISLKGIEDNIVSPDLEALLSKTQPAVPSKKKIKVARQSAKPVTSSTLPHSRSTVEPAKAVSSNARRRTLNRPKKAVPSHPAERKLLEKDEVLVSLNDVPVPSQEPLFSQSAVEIGIQADFEDIQLSSPLPSNSLRPSSFNGSRPSPSLKDVSDSKPSTPVRSASSPPSKHDNILSINPPSRPSSCSGRSPSKAPSRSPSRLHSPQPASASRSISVPTTPKPSTPKTPTKADRFFVENIQEDSFLDIPAVDIVISRNEEFEGLPAEEENKPILTPKKLTKGSRGFSKGTTDAESPAVKIQKLARGKLTRKRNNIGLEKEKTKSSDVKRKPTESKYKETSVIPVLVTGEPSMCEEVKSSLEQPLVSKDPWSSNDREVSTAVHSHSVPDRESSFFAKDEDNADPIAETPIAKDDKIILSLQSAESRQLSGGRSVTYCCFLLALYLCLFYRSVKMSRERTSAGSLLPETDEGDSAIALAASAFTDEKTFDDMDNSETYRGNKLVQEGNIKQDEEVPVVLCVTESSQEDKEKAAKKIQNLVRKIAAVNRLSERKRKVLKAQIDAAFLLDWCVRSIQKIVRIRQAKQKVNRLMAQRKVRNSIYGSCFHIICAMVL
jgi:hypothetical protein